MTAAREARDMREGRDERDRRDEVGIQSVHVALFSHVSLVARAVTRGFEALVTGEP